MMKTHRPRWVRLDSENTRRNKMKMKELLNMSVAILSVLVTQKINAQQSPFDMTEINTKLELVIGKKIHLNDDSAMFYMLQRESNFTVIENKCKADWSSIIDNFEAIEGGEVAQKMVVWAFQALDAGDYMSAIEKLVTRFEAGTVSKPVILEILYPKGRMRAFLADNHAHARVTAVLNKIKAKVGGDAELITQIDDMLSGESKLRSDKFRDAHQDTSEGNIPQVLLEP